MLVRSSVIVMALALGALLTSCASRSPDQAESLAPPFGDLFDCRIDLFRVSLSNNSAPKDLALRYKGSDIPSRSLALVEFVFTSDQSQTDYLVSDESGNSQKIPSEASFTVDIEGAGGAANSKIVHNSDWDATSPQSLAITLVTGGAPSSVQSEILVALSPAFSPLADYRAARVVVFGRGARTSFLLLEKM